MNQLFSNGPEKDFVINPFSQLLQNSPRLFIAAPYVTETDDLLNAARKGASIDLLVGLNESTSPKALSQVIQVSGFAVRYFTHRFHAKIYISDSAALVGSSNLTDGGLKSNREATVFLQEPDDGDVIDELRTLFLELWESAAVLTRETLTNFTAAYDEVHRPSPQSRIEAAVGRVEPQNINTASNKNTAERIFVERLRRLVYEEYARAFNEVMKLLEEHELHRPELRELGAAIQTNRFLNWVKKDSGEDAWANAPLRSPEERRQLILDLGQRWQTTNEPEISEDYGGLVLQARKILGSKSSIATASKDELDSGLLSIHAFKDQRRFVDGGIPALIKDFWSRNSEEKIRRTLTYLIHDRGDFIERLHDVLYDRSQKLAYFGTFSALELYGTVKPEECPPVNGRMAKALRYLGFNVRPD